MEIDLFRDWVAHLEYQLKSFGYDTTQLKTKRTIIDTFFNLTKRLIEPTPRQILRSRTFTVPPCYENGLIQVEQKIKSGEDITPYLSKNIRNPSFNDYLLNDWGIHHIHLGTVLENNGFTNRTGPVLFARFDNYTAYLIDVLPHGSWSLQELVRVLHDNWPESIQKYRAKNIHSLSRKLSDKEINNLRRGNISTSIDLGNCNVYSSIGGGYSTSGLSIDVVIKGDYCIQRLREMQKSIEENIESISLQAKKKGFDFPKNPQFGLRIEGKNLYAIEINSMVAVPLGEM